MVNIDKIKVLCKQKGIKQKYLCDQFGVAQVYFNDVAKGKNTMSEERILKCAKILGTSYEYLTDQTDDPSPKISANAVSPDKIMGKIEKTPDGVSNANIIERNRSVYMTPVFDSVSAGFGTYADNYITEYMPMYFSSPSEADKSIFVTVKGDSMFPKIEDGDIVLVHKQDDVDSGSIAVVLIDGEDALVKKIVYGDNCIELHSVNPMYQTLRFTGPDMSRIRVLGLVKKIIKSV